VLNEINEELDKVLLMLIVLMCFSKKKNSCFSFPKH